MATAKTENYKELFTTIDKMDLTQKHLAIRVLNRRRFGIGLHADDAAKTSPAGITKLTEDDSFNILANAFAARLLHHLGGTDRGKEFSDVVAAREKTALEFLPIVKWSMDPARDAERAAFEEHTKAVLSSTPTATPTATAIKPSVPEPSLPTSSPIAAILPSATALGIPIDDDTSVEDLKAALEEALEDRKIEEHATTIISRGYPFPEPDPDYPYIGNDDQIKDVRMALSMNRHILFLGPTGSGKSEMAKYLTSGLPKDRGLIRLNMNKQASPEHLVGKTDLDGKGGTHFVYGALAIAMMEGRPLLLDEVDFALPEVLSLLYPVLEPGGELNLKEYDGSVIKPKAGFRIFATGNNAGFDETGIYAGTNALNHAFLARFFGFYVDYPTKAEEIKMLRVHGVSANAAEASAKVAAMVRKLISDPKTSTPITGAWGVRTSLDLAELLDSWKGDTKRAMFMATNCKFSRPEQQVIFEVAQRALGNNAFGKTA